MEHLSPVSLRVTLHSATEVRREAGVAADPPLRLPHREPPHIVTCTPKQTVQHRLGVREGGCPDALDTA